jgi:PAS domain S-box-containing protein
MTIKNKIVITTTLMVAFAVLITATSVFFLLNQGIETQIQELSGELEHQSCQRIRAGRKILSHKILFQIERGSLIIDDLCNDNTIRDNISFGQWKALHARLVETSIKADSDFMIIFDTSGKVLASCPDQMDESFPESHFKELDLFKRFAPAIADKNLTEASTVSSFEKWDQKVLKAYNIENNPAEDIVILSADIIPNEYFDEPVGYVLTGITSNKLSSSFNLFFKTTGQLSLLMDKKIPLAWAGIAGAKNIFTEKIHTLDFDLSKNRGSDNTMINRIVLDKKAYRYIALPLIDFFTNNDNAHDLINVSQAASMLQIIVGEPAALIDNANTKIVKEGAKIKKNILITTLAIACFVLVLTFTVMGLVSRKIASPISAAANMSEKIASGDLSHVLNESGTDETRILSKSMNRMVKNLKELIDRNKRQLEALRESEKKFRTLFNTSHQAIALLEVETGTFIDVNDKLCEMSQFKHEAIIGKTTAQIGFFSRDDEKLFAELLANEGNVHDLEMDLYAKDSTIMNIRFHAVPIRMKDKNFFLAEFYDITEKKRLESQLRQSSKMESVGTIAGGIAHDFNNILYMIIGNTELIIEDIPYGNPVHENLKEIKSASLRAAAIVKQLLHFSRKADQEFKPIGAVTVIKEALKFMRSTITTSIEIRQNFPTAEITIHGDPTQINQVMMNLCINASQAMGETGGILDVTVKKINVNTRMNSRYPDLAPGEWLKIEISDTGPGISSEIIERIFDPYFTTKDVGKGSGMGLSVVHGIVINHDGKIFVDSNPGKGATITIYIPAVTEKPIMEVRTSDEIIKGTGEKILFVDDEASIVKMTSKMLERLGYTIEAETSPVKALELFKSKPDAFDIVITDMAMPNLTGVQLSERLKEVRPDIPVVICSGYSALIDEEKAISIGIDAYTMKPTVMRDIAKTIRNVMDKKKSKKS